MKPRISIALLASGIFAVAAFAGPGPQHWNKSAPAKPVEKPAPVKMDEHPTGKCVGCKTTPIWVIGDRGPSSKGVGARVAGYTHSCTGCVGKIVTENGKTTSDMKHSAGCAALACCK